METWSSQVACISMAASTAMCSSSADDGGALSVSESGFIEGNVEVTNIVMNGTVNGDMQARERLQLGGKARVNGNVHYGVIEMAPGAVITGKLVPLGKAPGDDSAETPPEAASGGCGGKIRRVVCRP